MSLLSINSVEAFERPATRPARRPPPPAAPITVPANAATAPYTAVEPVTYETHERSFGFIIGEPTGLTGKYYLDRQSAIDTGVAYSFKKFIVLYGDYLWHTGSTFLEPNEFTTRLNFYFGVGGGFKFSTQDQAERRQDGNDSVEVFLRIPAGVEWRPSDIRWGWFAEIAPGTKIIPGFDLMLMGGIGARYYF